MNEWRGKFHLPTFEYFDFKNIFSGNQGEFNYKIWPKEELKSAVWYGKNCYEKSTPAAENTFEKSEAGLDALAAWMEEQYQIWMNEPMGR